MLTHNRETNPMKCSGHELLATARETHSLLPMSGPRNQHAISALKHLNHNRETNPMKCFRHELLAAAQETQSW